MFVFPMLVYFYRLLHFLIITLRAREVASVPLTVRLYISAVTEKLLGEIDVTVSRYP